MSVFDEIKSEIGELKTEAKSDWSRLEQLVNDAEHNASSGEAAPTGAPLANGRTVEPGTGIDAPTPNTTTASATTGDTAADPTTFTGAVADTPEALAGDAPRTVEDSDAAKETAGDVTAKPVNSETDEPPVIPAAAPANETAAPAAPAAPVQTNAI